MTCQFVDPKEWLLEVTPKIQSRSWKQSQLYGTPSSRWCAYINQICLYAFLNWVKTEYALQANVWTSFADTPAFWEFVNGTAILLNQKKVVLIPTEAIDDGELEVPQEWIDIPSWIADFYIAVQVQPEEEKVRFWAYTTHKELKTLAEYDSVDRTYRMDTRNLTKDLNAFWMAYQFCQVEDVKAAIPSLPELSTNQAENMLQRLSSSKAIPKFEIPFTSWGALLENKYYREKLYLSRQQTVNLSAWLKDIYQASWEAIDTFVNSNSKNLVFNFRSNPDLSTANIKRAKAIHLGTEADSQQVVMLIELISSASSTEEQFAIRVQLHPLNNEYLPANIKLVLLSEAVEIIQEVQSRLQDNYVQLKLFEGEIGECFSIQVIFDSYRITEKFVI